MILRSFLSANDHEIVLVYKPRAYFSATHSYVMRAIMLVWENEYALVHKTLHSLFFYVLF